MKTFRFTMALLAVTMTTFLGCSKTDLISPKQSSISSRSSSNSVTCDPVTYYLIDKAFVQQGTVTVSNDATNVYIKIDVTATGFKLLKAALLIGTEQYVKDGTGLAGWPQLGPGPLNPDYSQTFPKPGVTSYTFTVPLGGLGDCFYFAIYGKICKKEAYGGVTDYIFLQSDTKSSKKCWSTYVQYCKCTPEECKPLNTVTQGGYGNDQGNGNPTQYLIANFDAAFPNGITIGCANADVKFTSAAAIQAYLPTSTTPTALSSGDHFVDGNTPNNILIGQILTLGLTLGFDANDPNFGAGSQLLSDMYIQSGPYAGMTVGDFFALANNVLGGCNTTEDPSDINDAANNINNNYDGNLWSDTPKDDGFLGCDPPNL